MQDPAVLLIFIPSTRDVNGREFARIGQGVLFLGSFARGSFLPRDKTPARKTSCPTEKNLPGSGRKLREFFFSGDLLRESAGVTPGVLLLIFFPLREFCAN